MRHTGRCHCGNLTVTFESARPPAEAPLRTCGCTFCARHRPTYTTDPAGRLEVHARDLGLLTRYRFGLATADFLLCSRCGVFVAAVGEVDGRVLGTLNVNVLEDRPAFTQPPAPVDYDGEDVGARLARRARAWTPAVVGPDGAGGGGNGNGERERVRDPDCPLIPLPQRGRGTRSEHLAGG